MGELEEQLNRVLNDPEQMAELNRLAQSLLGGDAPAAAAPPGPEAALLGRAAQLLGAGEGRSEGMLRALAPYLSPKRRARLERALKLGRMSRLLRLFGEEGGGV